MRRPGPGGPDGPWNWFVVSIYTKSSILTTSPTSCCRSSPGSLTGATFDQPHPSDRRLGG